MEKDISNSSMQKVEDAIQFMESTMDDLQDINYRIKSTSNVLDLPIFKNVQSMYSELSLESTRKTNRR